MVKCVIFINLSESKVWGKCEMMKVMRKIAGVLRKTPKVKTRSEEGFYFLLLASVNDGKIENLK